MDSLDTNLNPETPGDVNEKGVIFGREGFLYIVSTATTESRQRVLATDDQIEAIRATILERQARAKALSTIYASVIVPYRTEITPGTFPRADLPLWIANHPRFDDTLHYDTTPALKAVGDNANWKTDFHLAPEGAVAVAISIAKATSLVDEAELEYTEKSLPNLVSLSEEPFIGEIGRRCSPPRSEPGRKFNPAVFIRATAFDGPGNFQQRHPQEGDIVVTESLEALTDKTLMVFSTSLANATLGPLSHIFKRVIWARSARYVYWDLVEAARPDAVVSLFLGFGAIENFPTNDSLTPPFMAISKITGRALSLREQDTDLFATILPGVMASVQAGVTADPLWQEHVIGKPKFTPEPLRARVVSPEIHKISLS